MRGRVNLDLLAFILPVVNLFLTLRSVFGIPNIIKIMVYIDLNLSKNIINRGKFNFFYFFFDISKKRIFLLSQYEINKN